MSDLPEQHKRERDKWRNLKRSRPTQIEVPSPGQESVWNYPRPPRVEPVEQRIRVEFGSIVLAESLNSYRVVETAGPPVYYLPPTDVRMQYLERSSHSTLCEWKGVGQYWSVRFGQQLAENAAWSYPNPWEGYETIQDYIAFNASKMDACYVGSYRVTPQPGDYYGGWITPNIVGPFKGEPGTEQW